MCSSSLLRKCTKCLVEKDLEDFSIKCGKADGTFRYESRCKLCKKNIDSLRNKKKKRAKTLKKQLMKKQEFSYVFSLAEKSTDLKGAIDICMD